MFTIPPKQQQRAHARTQAHARTFHARTRTYRYARTHTHRQCCSSAHRPLATHHHQAPGGSQGKAHCTAPPPRALGALTAGTSTASGRTRRRAAAPRTPRPRRRASQPRSARGTQPRAPWHAHAPPRMSPPLNSTSRACVRAHPPADPERGAGHAAAPPQPASPRASRRRERATPCSELRYVTLGEMDFTNDGGCRK